jgi:cytoskeletal protein CcmA (bactofilin family)
MGCTALSLIDKSFLYSHFGGVFKKLKPQKSASPAETYPADSETSTSTGAESETSTESTYGSTWQEESESTYTAPSYSSASSTVTDSTKNTLSSDVNIKGSIRFVNELTIDGKIEGEISSEGVLTVGENAEIQGEIRTKSVSVHGKVTGNITVDERCELKSQATLIGDLKASRLLIEEGATFVGKSEVNPNRVQVAAPSVVPEEDASKITSFGSV